MENDRPITGPVFIIRWVLAQGIFKTSRDGMMVKSDGSLYVPGRYGSSFLRSSEWASTEEEAQQKAAAALQKKIKATERALEKLRGQVGSCFPVRETEL